MRDEEFRFLWHRIAPRAREVFEELTDRDLEVINGEKDLLIGILSRRGGRDPEDVEAWLDRFGRFPSGGLRGRGAERAAAGTDPR